MDETKIEILSGNIGVIEAIEFSDFAITANEERKIYEFPQNSLDLRWYWKGWGPFKQRVVKAQLEKDGKIWVVDQEAKFPVSKFQEQPEGFI